MRRAPGSLAIPLLFLRGFGARFMRRAHLSVAILLSFWRSFGARFVRRAHVSVAILLSISRGFGAPLMRRAPLFVAILLSFGVVLDLLACAARLYLWRFCGPFHVVWSTFHSPRASI